MKIEMGESIVYSWLRHVKGCQIVQNNWKVSPKWPKKTLTDLEEIRKAVEEKFNNQYKVFKQNKTEQFLSQGECDAIGISFQDNSVYLYGVDVAFHTGGLNYGSREVTVAKVIEKCIRTAMCLYYYFDRKDAMIVFVSPKVGNRTANDIKDAISTLKDVTSGLGYNFVFEVIMNNDFKTKILDTVILASNDVDDTAELFMRSYQMINLYYELTTKTQKRSQKQFVVSPSSYSTFKIGQLAWIVLKELLENGKASDQEITDMQTKPYSKNQFGLQYPLLVESGKTFDSARYYASPVKIKAKEYYMCSQWFETSKNNDRPLLEKWIKDHS